MTLKVFHIHLDIIRMQFSRMEPYSSFYKLIDSCCSPLATSTEKPTGVLKWNLLWYRISCLFVPSSLFFSISAIYLFISTAFGLRRVCYFLRAFGNILFFIVLLSSFSPRSVFCFRRLASAEVTEDRGGKKMGRGI